MNHDQIRATRTVTDPESYREAPRTANIESKIISGLLAFAGEIALWPKRVIAFERPYG